MTVRAAEAVDARKMRSCSLPERTLARALAISLLAAGLLAVAPSARAGETPRVRTSVHGDFARLVLDFDKKMPAKAEIRENGMTITFERPVEVQASLPVAKLGGYLQTGSLSGDGRTLTFTFPRPLRVETTTYKDTLVFDLKTSAKVDTRNAADAKAEAKKAADKTEAKPKKADARTEAKPAEAAPEKTADTPKPAGPTPSRPDGAGSDSAAARKLDQLASEVAATPPPPPLPVVPIQPEMLPNGVRLTIDWPVPVPAAVFVRGERLWLVFDAAARIDTSALTDAFAGAVVQPVQAPHDTATVLTLHLARPLYPVARRRGGAWTVDLTDSARTPERPITIEREDVSTGKARAILPTTDPVDRLILADTDAGDEISVIPLATAGSAMALQRDLPQARLLATAQGMAIVPLADDIAIEAVPTGVAISAPGGLTISPDRNVAETAEPSKAVIDWAAWADDHGDDPMSHRRELVQAVAAKPAGERNLERLALARALVGQGMGADASGVLRVVATADPNIANDPEFRALRGIANVQLGRYDDAAADLAHPALEFDPHASLWRSRIATARRNWPEAREQFAKGATGLAAYDPAGQARFRLDAARAAIGAGDLDAAAGELPDIVVPKGDAELRATKAFLEGQLAQAQGDAAAALGHYEDAVAEDWRPVRVEAEYARTNLEFTEGKITPEEATNRLERLRFAWRGDGFERMVLGRLATLYAQRLDWRSSLTALRTAVTAFPKAPETPAFKAQMSDIFLGLFLKGGADALTPVSALALYYDFRELTPNGPEGDEMIRRLSDRLASVDLLDRAAELLEHQVRYRLNGVAKAQVSARLALVYLLDRQPDKALETLDKSDQPLLPDALASQRRLLRARALADLDRPKDALDVLADDQSVPASELISEVAWKAEAWPLVVATNETLLGTRWKDPAPLNQAERGRVLRTAVAMTLSNDAAGLDRLRANWAEKMKGGVGADAFAVITGRVDPRTTAFRNLANTIANIGALESFMASYRDRVQGSGLSAIN